jgi:hypothetical protein
VLPKHVKSVQKYKSCGPKLQIICIIFEKTGAFYGLAAILDFSAILNFKERQQEK